jgi:hypothetical protein
MGKEERPMLRNQENYVSYMKKLEGQIQTQAEWPGRESCPLFETASRSNWFRRGGDWAMF